MCVQIMIHQKATFQQESGRRDQYRCKVRELSKDIRGREKCYDLEGQAIGVGFSTVEVSVTWTHGGNYLVSPQVSPQEAAPHREEARRASQGPWSPFESQWHWDRKDRIAFMLSHYRNHSLCSDLYRILTDLSKSTYLNMSDEESL